MKKIIIFSLFILVLQINSADLPSSTKTEINLLAKDFYKKINLKSDKDKNYLLHYVYYYLKFLDIDKSIEDLKTKREIIYNKHSKLLQEYTGLKIITDKIQEIGLEKKAQYEGDPKNQGLIQEVHNLTERYINQLGEESQLGGKIKALEDKVELISKIEDEYLALLLREKNNIAKLRDFNSNFILKSTITYIHNEISQELVKIAKSKSKIKYENDAARYFLTILYQLIYNDIQDKDFKNKILYGSDKGGYFKNDKEIIMPFFPSEFPIELINF